MKGNKILKQISKVLLSVCLVFAFLCTPITKFFGKVAKVFAESPSELTDITGANVKVEGFKGSGEVGKGIALPTVKVNGGSSINVTEENAGLVYDVKTSTGKTVTTDTTFAKIRKGIAELGEDTTKYYLVSTVEGVYTLDIHTVEAGKLQTVVKGLQINVTKADASIAVSSTSVVANGTNGIVLPAKISLAKIKSEDFKMPLPTLHKDGKMENVVVKCIPAGSTSDAAKVLEAIKDTDGKITHFAFKAEDRTALNSKGRYTFIYSYTTDGTKLCADAKITCEVADNDKYLDDITLAMSTTITDPELKSGNIGIEYSLPTATVYNSKSGSTDAIPAVVTIKVTPASDIANAKVKLDGYKLTVDTIGTYHVVYTATYPYSDKKVERNFVVEMKDEISPEVMFVEGYDRDAYFASHTDATETDFVESLVDKTDAIKSIYVLAGDSATINIPAIYAKDNSTDGKYTFTRTITKTDNNTVNIEEDSNKTATFTATTEGVYTIQYSVTDGNNKQAIAKKSILVVKQATLSDVNAIDDETSPTIVEASKPKVTTGTTPRTVKSDGTFSIAVPTATDTITTQLKEKFTRLKSSSIAWTSNVELTTTLVAYDSTDQKVDGKSYEFTKDDIDESGKYTIDMKKVFGADELAGVAYFKVITTASTDWMTALNLGKKTVESSKITYVKSATDTNASTIAFAEFDGETTFAGILSKKNATIINNTIDKYKAKHTGCTFTATINNGGMLECTGSDAGHSIAPFNQYSADNNAKVMFPDLLITDAEDGTQLSVTGTITDSLGNTKTFVPTIDKIELLTGVYNYYVTLGEFELTTAGMYTVSITAKDMGDNYSVYSFGVMVNDTTSPSDIVLDTDLVGESTISKTYYTGEFISFPEAKIVDNVDENCEYTAKLTDYPEGARLTENVFNGGFTTLTAGTYEITYDCKDNFGNTFSKTYSLEVTAKDHTTIIVDESLFEDNFTYAFDDSKITNKITIPGGTASNTVDPEINGKTIKPTVKNKNNVTQTVSVDGDQYSFNATQGIYTITYKEGSVTRTYTIYVGDTDAPVLTWKKEIPSTIKLNEKWGKGIKDMYEITDVKNGETSTITDSVVTITNPDGAKKTIDGSSDYTFDKEGTYTITITFDDGVNEEKVTKTITVSSDTKDATVNPTNVVGVILVIAAVLVAGGLVVYLILSSKKAKKNKNK